MATSTTQDKEVNRMFTMLTAKVDELLRLTKDTHSKAMKVHLTTSNGGQLAEICRLLEYKLEEAKKQLKSKQSFTL